MLHASVLDLTTAPIVAASTTLDPPPRLAWHTTPLSPAHTVHSHPVFPALADTLRSPPHTPTTIATTAPPAPAQFDPSPTLPPADPLSYDTASVTLTPTSPPAVVTTRTLPPPPDAPKHLTTLSDTHHVPSLALPPSPARTE